MPDHTRRHYFSDGPLAAQRAAGETSWTDFAAFRLVYGTLAAFAEQNPSCFTPERRAEITALNRLLTS
jgi:hypothetical protein